ncbi:hypothetical protein ['Paenibacillus yunnanensis' Narsing Rao et al. 2020]|uniref:hypothetical protein n=1 Tax=Paenibacillus tengchongensis TaxID=2608684 RepID=UPI001651D98E|nr:hypothetical protein [Paenibacillus tengchongensis]
MINPKKLKTAFKKYKKDVVSGTNYEVVRQDYDERSNEVQDIVDSNQTEKDHILLLSHLDIFTYYLKQWKKDVLVNGGKRTETLKIMQMTVFYQCMGHDLYKVKYPKMRVGYSFGDVVGALIHFTMFGWEKEENILFDFIANNLGGHLMQARESDRHIWFLLELYLQLRDKRLLDTDQQVHLAVIQKFKEAEIPYGLIPEDLGIYGKVLEQWKTASSYEMEQLIAEMSVRHSVLVSEIDKMGEFGDYRYGFYPYEILFLLHARTKIGMPVPNEFNDFLMNTPEAKMEFNIHEPYPEWDPLMRSIDDFYRKNYPEYLPNQYGGLFQ